MDVKKTLAEIGLKEGEIEVYLALLKTGASSAGRLKSVTQMHRTTIYDFLDGLVNKGLASFVKEDKSLVYKAVAPSKLMFLIKEKEENLKKIIPELERIAKISEDRTFVEVHKGVEGYKYLLDDIIYEKDNVLGFGVAEVLFEKKFPYLMSSYFQKLQQKGIKERILTSEKAVVLYKNFNTHYRFIPEKFFDNTPTFIYGNKVASVIWDDPVSIIIIKNKNFAQSHRKHFELLWKNASKK